MPPRGAQVKIEITGDARKLGKATAQGERDLDEFAGTFRDVAGDLKLDASTLYASRGQFEKAGKAITKAVEKGLTSSDPAKSIDLDASTLYSSRGDFEKAGRAVGDAVGDGVSTGAKGAGKRAGDDLDASAVRSKRGDFEAAGRQVGEGVGEGVGSGIDTSGAGDALSEGMGSLLDGLPLAAGGPAAIAGGLVATAIVGGMRTALEEESVGDVLAARAGVDNQNAEMFGKVAGELYAGGFGDSITEVGDVVGEVYARIGDSRQGEGALSDLVTRAMSFADVMDVDVSQAVENAGILMDTGLADSGVEAFDLLTAGAEGLTSIQRDELMSATEEYAQYLGGLGFTGEESFGLLRDAADGGRYMIDKAGDSVKEFTILNKAMSDQTRDAYRDLGYTDDQINTLQDTIQRGGPEARTAFEDVVTAIQSVKDPSEKSAAALAIFGTPFEDISGDASKTNDVLNTLANDGMPAATGASDDLSSAYDNTAANFETNSRRIQTSLGWVGESYAMTGSYILSSETRGEVHNAMRFNWAMTVGLIRLRLDEYGGYVWNAGVNMVNEVKTWPERIWGYLSGLFAPIGMSISGAAGIVSAKASEIIGTVRSIPSRLGDFGSSLYGAGRDLIEGMIRGVGSKARELADRAIGVARGAVNAVKDFLGINSPSRVFAEIGAQTMDGLSIGITTKGSTVVAAARGVADQVTAAATLGDLTPADTQYRASAGAALRTARNASLAPSVTTTASAGGTGLTAPVTAAQLGGPPVEIHLHYHGPTHQDSARWVLEQFNLGLRQGLRAQGVAG